MNKLFFVLFFTGYLLAMKSDAVKITTDDQEKGVSQHFSKCLSINNKSVGGAAYYIQQVKDYDKVTLRAIIEEIKIYEQFQNRGYGKLLLISVLKDIYQKVGHNLIVWAKVDTENLAAVKLFRSIRFHGHCNSPNGTGLFDMYNKAVYFNESYLEILEEVEKETENKVKHCEKSKNIWNSESGK
jgi:ribosomal protein S18 acetylase RimI-like enzyme